MDLSSTLSDVLSKYVVLDASHDPADASIADDPSSIRIFWPDASVRLDISCASTYRDDVDKPGVVMATPAPINVPGGENINNPHEEEPSAPPVLDAVTPDNIAAGGSGFTLTLTGSGFTPGCNVKFGEAVGNLQYVSDTEGTFDVGPEGYAQPGTVQVSVSGSNSLPFTIT